MEWCEPVKHAPDLTAVGTADTRSIVAQASVQLGDYGQDGLQGYRHPEDVVELDESATPHGGCDVGPCHATGTLLDAKRSRRGGTMQHIDDEALCEASRTVQQRQGTRESGNMEPRHEHRNGFDKEHQRPGGERDEVLCEEHGALHAHVPEVYVRRKLVLLCLVSPCDTERVPVCFNVASTPPSGHA